MSKKTFRQVTVEHPPRVRLLNRRVPKDLETICHKALAKRPRDRYPIADDLAADLRRFRQGLPVVARPVPWTTRMARWSRRNPPAASLIGLLLLLGFMIPSGTVWMARQAQSRGARERSLRERANTDSTAPTCWPN